MLVAFAAAVLLFAAPSSGLTFNNESSATFMTLSTTIFQLSLYQSNGTVSSLLSSSGQPLLLGSDFYELWSFCDETTGACHDNQGSSPFAYAWEAQSSTLVMTWGDPVSVRVNVSAPAAADAPYFDMALELLSAPSTPLPRVYGTLRWPSALLFNESDVASVFYPKLPGISLNATFFEASSGTSVPYPGSGTFADLVSLEFTSGATLAIMAVAGPQAILPTYLGFYPALRGGKPLWSFKHQYLTNVSEGCDVTNGGWSGDSFPPPPSTGGAPPCSCGVGGLVRTRLVVGDASSSSSASALTAVQLYASANGFDGATQPPPLASKALPLSALQAFARAPLYKLDALEVGLNFSSYASVVFPLLPVAGLVHSMAFEPHGFDRWYPDYLPPNEALGTGCDLADAFAAAQAAAHLAVPYTNPTWWDPLAPTLSSSLPPPLTLSDVTVHNASGLPWYETYPDKPPATGVVTQLGHEYVQGRWSRLMQTLSSRAASNDGGDPRSGGSCNESGVRLGSDLIFEDQIGARNPYPDTNFVAGGLGALYAAAALVGHAANWSALGLLTEQGFDRVAAHEIGFYGNAIEEIGASLTDYPFGYGGWAPMPVANALFGGSVIAHVHNLETAAFATDPLHACWTLASGAGLSIDAAQARNWTPEQAAWYRFVGLLSRYGSSRLAGRTVTALAPNVPFGSPPSLGVGVSTTTFAQPVGAPPLFPDLPFSDAFVVHTNWAYEAAATVVDAPAAPNATPRSYTLPPTGCALLGDSRDVVAGLFTVYNNRTLSQNANASSFHAIVEDHAFCSGDVPGTSPLAACLFHPVGGDTLIDVGHPGCGDGSAPAVTARFANGTSVPTASTYDNATLLVTFTARDAGPPSDKAFYVVDCQ